MSLFGIDLSQFSENGLIIIAAVFLVLYFIFQIIKLILQVKFKAAEANQPITHADICTQVDEIKALHIATSERQIADSRYLSEKMHELTLAINNSANVTSQQVKATDRLIDLLTIKGVTGG